MEFDVIALPNGRCLAGIDARGGNFVNGTAIVVLTVEPVAVQDLHFIAALQIHAAVAARLTGRTGHVRYSELHVEFEGTIEFVAGHDVASLHLHDAAFEQLPARLALAITLDPAIRVL